MLSIVPTAAGHIRIRWQAECEKRNIWLYQADPSFLPLPGRIFWPATGSWAGSGQLQRREVVGPLCCRDLCLQVGSFHIQSFLVVDCLPQACRCFPPALHGTGPQSLSTSRWREKMRGSTAASISVCMLVMGIVEGACHRQWKICLPREHTCPFTSCMLRSLDCGLRKFCERCLECLAGNCDLDYSVVLLFYRLKGDLWLMTVSSSRVSVCHCFQFILMRCSASRTKLDNLSSICIQLKWTGKDRFLWEPVNHGRWWASAQGAVSCHACGSFPEKCKCPSEAMLFLKQGSGSRGKVQVASSHGRPRLCSHLQKPWMALLRRYTECENSGHMR